MIFIFVIILAFIHIFITSSLVGCVINKLIRSCVEFINKLVNLENLKCVDSSFKKIKKLINIMHIKKI
jgi:hypothetical protein